jgi:Flp pilus assembly protein TadB
MSEQAGRGSTAVRDRSVAQLVQDMSDQLRRLVRDELRLATEELKLKGRRAGVGAGLAGAAGVIALYGGGTLIAAAVLALALVLPAWASALVIGGVLLLIGGIAGLLGRSRLKAAVPPMPREAVAGLAKDVRAIRDGGRHDRA